MGFHVNNTVLNTIFKAWQTEYNLYAPRKFSGGGRFLILTVSAMEKLAE